MTSPQLAYKEDAADACRRMEAWWNRAVLDRPTIQVTAPRPPEQRVPVPRKEHATLRERWMDVEYNVARADAHAANTYWGGEILPNFMPNLGPEILTASLGAELEFTEDSSWSVPILENWDDAPTLRFDPENVYVRTIQEMTRRALEVGRGKFIVGLTDFHAGADLAASLRDPQQFCVDLAMEPEKARALVAHLRPVYYRFYEMQHRLLLDCGQTLTTSWLPLFSEGRYYIPQCDFSCMISPTMFQEFFLPGIVEEIHWLDHSIYHLDGPDALRHLDTLLAIEKLDAVQWVYGAGNEPASQWIPVCQRIQKAGKGVHIAITPGELETFMENLRPEGVMLQTWAGSAEEADALIARVARWRTRK